MLAQYHETEIASSTVKKQLKHMYIQTYMYMYIDLYRVVIYAAHFLSVVAVLRLESHL